MRPIRDTWFLLLVPLAVLILSALLADARGPYSLGRNFDPDYNYLFNSLNFLLFHTAGATDHPGTTTQLLGAMVVFGKWFTGSLFGNWTSLEETVLRHPEDFLHAINTVIVILIAAAVFLAGLRMYRESGSRAAAVILQTSAFCFRETLVALPRVSPEALLIAVSFAMMIPLIRTMLQKESSKGFDALLAGIFRGIGQRARFVLACLLAGFVFVLPILSELPSLARYLYSVAIHRNSYGGGPAGLPSWPQLSANLQSMYQAEPFLFIWLAYYVIVLLGLYFGTHEPAYPLAISTRRLLWAGQFPFRKGDNTILLKTTGPFPHVAKLALAPVAACDPDRGSATCLGRR